MTIEELELLFYLSYQRERRLLREERSASIRRCNQEAITSKLALELKKAKEEKE